MKDELKELLASAAPGREGLNLVREALQATALASLQRSGAMRALAFQGGTALRFLYSLARLHAVLERPISRAATSTIWSGISATANGRSPTWCCSTTP